MVDWAGAAVGTAFGELFRLVKHIVTTVAAFRDQLEDIQTTLGQIEPIMEIIDKYNGRLNRDPEEMAPIKKLLHKGKALVDECSRIPERKKYKHSKKLAAFNNELMKKFQLYVLLLSARDEKETLVSVKKLGEKVEKLDDMLTSITNVILRPQGGPEAPDSIVGSEMAESSRKLNKVGMSRAASEGEAVREISTADSQQCDFSTIRAATQQFELGTLEESNNSAKKFQTSNGRSFFAMLSKMKWKKKKKPRRSVEGEIVDEIITAGPPQFDLGTIRAATDNFSHSKKRGEGGFGVVYEGRLPDGQEIAVKRLSWRSSQGQREFTNEIMVLAKLQHRNLVRFLGFCLEEAEWLLIYEFVPNSSLDRLIFDPLMRANLDWDRRHEIIMGVARGLLYLHEDSGLRIIHRDVKASNILLDSDMNPKISDFGLARRLLLDQTQAETTCIVGTCAYMAPEYAMHGKFSDKSDVYSFGVLVLEIVSGQGNHVSLALTSYVWEKWREGTISNFIDPSITSGSSTEIARCIHIGLLCVQENAASRPTMASVLLMLSSHWVPLQVPSSPAFFIQNGIEADMSSTDQFSKNEASIMQDYSSSEYDVGR